MTTTTTTLAKRETPATVIVRQLERQPAVQSGRTATLSRQPSPAAVIGLIVLAVAGAGAVGYGLSTGTAALMILGVLAVIVPVILAVTHGRR